MNSSIRGWLLALASTLALAAPARADEVVVKLGTLAPADSPWHDLLKEMAQKWKEASGGQVTLRVYPGGRMGNEGEMVRKMRINQLQAVAITGIGLHDITPEPQGLIAPGLIQSGDEFEYVISKLRPTLDKALMDKGYVPIIWGQVGFVRFFSTRPMRSAADRAGFKMFAWDGDPSSTEAWKAAGFQTVILSATDQMPAFQTGMIDAIGMAPLYGFTTRIFTKANKMLDHRWALLSGATVVRKETWEQIQPDVRAKLLAIAESYGKRINAEVMRMEEDAIKQMKAQGLEVVPVGDAAQWQKVADDANRVVRGKVITTELFDEIQRLARERRSGKR